MRCPCPCVYDVCQVSLRTLKLGRLPAVKAADIHALDRILEKDIPSYRRQASKSVSFSPPPAPPTPTGTPALPLSEPASESKA